jgi:Ca-activated chloride channel family protein
MFGRPWMLLLLVVPLLHLVFVWRRRGGRTALPFDAGLAGSGWFLRGLLGLGESLPSALLAIAVLVLAEPHELAAPRQRRAMTNIQLCVDISGSMSARFGAGTRYDVSMKAIEQFLTYRAGDAFGLTYFGNSFVHWVPLTSEPSAIRNASKFMGPENNVPGFGGTEIAKAVLACRDVLVERSEGDRMLILVTDGWSSDLGGGNEMEIAKQLRRDGIKLYAINIQESEARGEIVNLARLTGGEVFNPGDTRALHAVFQSIDEMSKARLEQTAAELVDWFWPFALAGLGVLGLFVLVQFGLRYTPW